MLIVWSSKYHGFKQDWRAITPTVIHSQEDSTHPDITNNGQSDAVELHRTLRLTLTALALLPYYIDHAAHLSPGKERLLDFLRKARFLRKVKTSITRLSKKSILSLMDESITSTGSVLNQLPPCRISVPYCPDSQVLAMTILLRLLELFELLQTRQKELQGSVL